MTDEEKRRLPTGQSDDHPRRARRGRLPVNVSTGAPVHQLMPRPLTQVPVTTLRAALQWSNTHTDRFSVALVARQLQVSAEEAERWLDILVRLNLLTRSHTIGPVGAYVCTPQLAAGPTADGRAGRALDEVSEGELWAAIRAAQSHRGAVGEDIAGLLDARAGRVDRLEVTLRLATAAAGGLLIVRQDAQRWRWQMSGPPENSRPPEEAACGPSDGERER